MPAVPTVKIQNPNEPGGYIIINESDYDEGQHTLWSERPEGAPPADAPPAGRPDDPDALNAAIVGAMRQVIASGSGLTAAGVPKVDAIEAVLGYDVSADERDRAWVEFETE